MYQLMSLPLAAESLGEYESWRDLRQELHGLGCQGVEAIWGGEPIPEDFPRDLAIGYHLTFYPELAGFLSGGPAGPGAKIRQPGDGRGLFRRLGGGPAAVRLPGGPGPGQKPGGAVCGIPRIGCVD